MKTKDDKREMTADPAPIAAIRERGDQLEDKLPGVLCQGVQYYDMKHVHFINNTGLVGLVNLLKSLLKRGVEVRFVNVCESIKRRIRSMGLDNILNCH
jgi:anti-anti-sigma factor